MGIERLKGAYNRAAQALSDFSPDSVTIKLPSEPITAERREEVGHTRPTTPTAFNPFEEQIRRTLRDVATLRQDVDTVMLMASKMESQQAAASRLWSQAQAGLAKESMALIIQLTDDHKNLTNDMNEEARLREHLAEELKEESLRRENLAEELWRERSERNSADEEIVSSIRQVVEQGAAFRDAVCKEAAEERTTFAQELRSSLEATAQQRIAELQASIQISLDGLSQRCDAQERFSKTTTEQRVTSLHAFVEEVEACSSSTSRSVAMLTQRCDSLEENSQLGVKNVIEMRNAIEAELSEASEQRAALATDLQATIQEKAAALRLLVDAEAESVREALEASAALAEDLK